MSQLFHFDSRIFFIIQFSKVNFTVICFSSTSIHNALLQIMGFSWFLTTPTDLTMVVFIRTLKIVRRCPWCFAKQIIRDLVLSCIVIEEFNLFIHVENLLDKIWRFVNLVTYVSQQRGSPCLDAFGIFYNNICLLELRGGMYLAPGKQY